MIEGIEVKQEPELETKLKNEEIESYLGNIPMGARILHTQAHTNTDTHMIDDSNHVVIENGHEIKKNNELKDKEINTLKAKGLQNEIEKEVTLENVPKGVPEIEMNIEMENTQGIEQEKVEP